LDQVYSHDLDGEGVTAYIIDSGIRSTHDEFEGRVECGFNAFDANFIHLAREDCEDYSGHGTHVAGTGMSYFSCAVVANTIHSIPTNVCLIMLIL
jgi:subtilisin family serine protease